MEGLWGVPSEPLERLDLRTLGSTFSVSNSSLNGERRRFVAGLRESLEGEKASSVGIAVQDIRMEN
jgi:hypothetical protein